MRIFIPFVLPLCYALIMPSVRLGNSESSSGKTLPAIFCAERDFPEDLTCNFDQLFSFPPFSEEGMRELYIVDFEFPFEDTFRNICMVNYSPGESKTPDRLVFQYDTCLNDEKKVNYKMHEISHLMIIYDGLNTHECKFYFMYEKTIEGGPLKSKSVKKSVVFRLRNYKCDYKTDSGFVDGAQYFEQESTRDPKTNRDRPAKSE